MRGRPGNNVCKSAGAPASSKSEFGFLVSRNDKGQRGDEQKRNNMHKQYTINCWIITKAYLLHFFCTSLDIVQ